MIKKIIKEIRINNRPIGNDHPVFIIAEAGVNHNGRLDLALRLIDVAKEVGADAIKFQTFKAGQVVTGAGKMAEYQKNNIGKSESQLKMLKKLELKEEFYEPILNYCKKKKIIFLSTPHGGFESVDLLQSFNIPAFKFGSGDLTNLPVLKYAAKFKNPIIVGTGMATMKEVRAAIKAIKKAGNNKIIALHCTTNYPCPLEEVNLGAMQTMTKELDVLVGYSDHTKGIQTSIIASSLGAQVIEKHFTLDKGMLGPDHKASTEPREFKEMVEAIRRIKTIIGHTSKKPNKNEIPMIKTVRKSVVSLGAIQKGETFTTDNIGIKRPGTGINPENFDMILGKIAKKNIKNDYLIKVSDYAQEKNINRNRHKSRIRSS